MVRSQQILGAKRIDRAAVQRLSMISLLEDFVDAPPAERKNIELVINKLIEAPLFFGKDITPKLQAAMENNRFAEELRALQKDRKFKQKLLSIAAGRDLTCLILLAESARKG